MFQVEGVGQGQQQVTDQDRPKRRTQPKRYRQADDHEHDCSRHRHPRGEDARRQGAVTFGGVLAVFFDIDQVVDEVGGAGNQAETDERHRGTQKERRLEQFAVEHQGGVDEAVFCPLARTHRLEQGPRHHPEARFG